MPEIATVAAPTATVGAPTTVPSEAESPLSVWAVPAFAPANVEPDGARGFVAAIEAAAANDARLECDVTLVPERGPEGVLALLASTTSAAPNARPDVVMLPLDVLGAAIAQGLIQPVPDTVPSGRVDDAYGFARDAAYQGGVDHAWAVPFAVDVAHAIARDEPVPATWEQAIDEGVLFVLPSGEYPGAAALIGSAYLSGDYSGAAQGDGDEGTPGNDGTSGVAAVDAARLSSSITPLANAIAAQVVAAPDAEASTSVRAAWNTFLLREAERAVVSAGVFAPHQAGFPALTWGPIPTGEGKGPSRPIGWGWGLAVTTPDPARAAIAGDLIAHLTEPGDAGWVLGADYLPALATGWPEQVANGIDPAPSTEYIDFVEDLLASAVGVGELPGRWEAWGGVAESLLSGSSAADAAATMSAE